jgi:hypothetical protein
LNVAKCHVWYAKQYDTLGKGMFSNFPHRDGEATGKLKGETRKWAKQNDHETSSNVE